VEASGIEWAVTRLTNIVAGVMYDITPLPPWWKPIARHRARRKALWVTWSAGDEPTGQSMTVRVRPDGIIEVGFDD